MESAVSDFFDLLCRAQILQAPALPLSAKSKDGFYADMALITNIGGGKIIGQAADRSDGGEAFYLDFDNFDVDQYWHDKQGRPAWPPHTDPTTGWSAVDLVSEMKGTEMDAFFAGGRELRFCRDDNDLEIGFRGPLQSAAAMTLTAESQQLCIYATPKFPCSIEVVIEPSRIAAILTELEEFYLAES